MASKKTIKPPVMILGCGRSGTSIFGELFDGLDGYRYRSEPAFADVIKADYAFPQAFKVPHESKGFTPNPGLSFPLDRFFEIAPKAQIFWIVRNPLDAVCSLRVGIAKNWGHHPRPPNWETWLSRPLHIRCAHHWRHLNSTGYDQVKRSAQLVTFEDMIADPMAFARNICKLLGLCTDKNARHLISWADRVQNSNNNRFVEAETSREYSRPDHTVRVDRWRENLTAAEAKEIWALVSDTALDFGYCPPS